MKTLLVSPLTLALAIGLLAGLPLIALSSPTPTTRLAQFVPPPVPPQGAPGQRQGAASRGQCPSTTKPLTALVPLFSGNNPGRSNIPSQSNPILQSNPESITSLVWGSTASARPGFWFYVPYAVQPQPTLEFVLQDDQGNTIYKTELAGTLPGVVGVQLPETAAPLSPDKPYHWYFLVYCNPNEPVFVDGWIQRSNLSSALQRQLATAPPRQKLALYRANGFWYDTLTIAAELRRTNPTDPSLLTAWTDLLRSIGLEALNAEPVVPCCTAKP
ncbi:DUF928 domain-containing protein [Leptolyngbya sp. FACHB-261]|uniref:DUF928 domain-containing protein n=1 Tax=Leptolyngbya sp. FACHB-261 TaxID=2692806 RepID=UPI00168312BD|nr:DUF928 domain-containing protein [Leptolyngbya sp. FACHB-261]MBD2103158.1 DUF928 domain-containing protein [Leptolyngbya sp. FACHB-261]